MNKRNKLIVSVVGITIVLLALLGITYAYYLTRIQGNTNTNSISITTANLKLEYGDGNGIISVENIVPGTTIGEKTFTVSNTGNTTIENYGISLDYAEIVKDDKIVVPSIFLRPEDFEITLTCKDNNGDDCNGYTGNFNNESIIMATSSIEPNEIHNYSLKIYYANPDIDQSNDMGKNLNLKVNIFSVNESTDINGTISGVDSTYAVRIESEPKLSTIVSGKYKLKGVEVGTHTLSIIDKDGNVVKSQKLVVQTGDNPGITTTTVDSETVPLITINENNRVAPLNTTYDKTTTTITSSGTSMTKFNPYENNKNTLAYNIINNSLNTTDAQKELGYAWYSDKPITTPAVGLGNIVYTSATDPETFNSSSASTSYYFVYSDQYSIDADGYYSLIDPKIGKYTEIYSDMVGKYVLLYSGYSTLEQAEEKLETNYSNSLYKVSEETTSTTIYYGALVKNFENVESVLTTTLDDHGTSYYYRGGIKNNYVNFAGMCWRIVRIGGDGSIKLILEDATYQCDDTLYTGNFVIGEGVYGYQTVGSYIKQNYLDSEVDAMAVAFQDYQETLAGKIDSSLSEESTDEMIDGILSKKLKSGDWCFDTTAYSKTSATYRLDYTESIYDEMTSFFYGGYLRSRNKIAPTLKCVDYNNKSMTLNNFLDGTKMYVSSLTSDEVVFAGTKNKNNLYFYLMNDFVLGRTDIFWWLNSLARYRTSKDNVFSLDYEGYMDFYEVNDANLMVYRPAIQLLSGTEISGGTGTQSEPYIIK